MIQTKYMCDGVKKLLHTSRNLSHFKTQGVPWPILVSIFAASGVAMLGFVFVHISVSDGSMSNGYIYVCTYRGIHRLGHLIYIAGLHLCGMEYGQEGAPLLSCDYTNHCHDYMSTNSPIATNNDIDKDVVHYKCLYDQ